jgi:hypothetical protein
MMVDATFYLSIVTVGIPFGFRIKSGVFYDFGRRCVESQHKTISSMRFLLAKAPNDETF